MKLNKWLTLFLVLTLAMTMVLSACGTKDEGTKEPKEETPAEQPAEQPAEETALNVAMVTDLGGVNDNSFNQSAWEGLQQLNADTGINVDYIESQSDADYVPNLSRFVKEGKDLTWGIGFLMEDSIRDVANQNQDSKLAIIDSDLSGDIPANVTPVLFKEQEGSFLVGVVAAKMTETGKIGFIGGMEIPVIKRFEAGFVQGVKAVNPDLQPIVIYTGAFNAPDKGKQAAATMFDQGADIVFHAAGATGDGLFGEVKERRDKGEKVWAIGVDRDQSITFGDEVTLTSMVKRVDEAVYQVSKDLSEGKWNGGEVVHLGLAENGVGLPAENPNISEDVLAEVESYKEKIVNGEITVAETLE